MNETKRISKWFLPLNFMSYPYQADSTKRFSNRVDDYMKYRPGYPQEIVSFAADRLQLSPEAIVADIGSGTGLLSQLFLENGNQVYGVEPNDDMRIAGETRLAAYANFVTVAGTAEATTLADDSVDFITAGQAFHWFKPEPSRVEFQRILKSGGWVVLVWNNRNTASSLMAAYESLLEEYTFSYQRVKAGDPSESLAGWFQQSPMQLQEFDNFQIFDFAGIRGRLLSSSYSPLPDHPNYLPMIAALRTLFNRYQQDGFIRFQYKTQLYFGQLEAASL